MYEVNIRHADDTPNWSEDVNRERLIDLFPWIETLLPPADYGDGVFKLVMYQELQHTMIRGRDNN